MTLDGERLQLELLMRAPIDSAHASPLTTQLSAMVTLLSQVRFAIITRADAVRTPGAIPTMPRLLSILPETDPATCVPWLSHALTGLPPPPCWLVPSNPGV